MLMINRLETILPIAFPRGGLGSHFKIKDPSRNPLTEVSMRYRYPVCITYKKRALEAKLGIKKIGNAPRLPSFRDVS
jgi:hypothetical protein